MKDTRKCWIYWTQSKTQNKKSSDRLIMNPWATMGDPNEDFPWVMPGVQRSWQALIATPPFILPQYLPITIITICTFTFIDTFYV